METLSADVTNLKEKERERRPEVAHHDQEAGVPMN